MAIGSGLGGQFGIKSESAYGTYVAPDHFYAVESAALKKVKNTKQGGGIAAGRMMQLGSLRSVTSQGGEGDVSVEVQTKNFGIWLQHILGSTGTPVQQGGTAAYLQSHSLGDNAGKYFTAQNGVPNAGGTVTAESFLGCKIISAEFSCGIDDLLMVKMSIDARDYTEAQTLATASYVAVQPFTFAEMGLKLGTFGAEAAVQGVKKVTLKFERPQNTDRFYANNTGLKAEPIMSDFVKVSGSIEVDFVNKADFHDRYVADTSTALVWEFIKPVAIAASNFPTFRLRVPQIFFDEGNYTLDSKDVASHTFNFVAQYDGTNTPITADYMSTDTTI